MDNELKENSVDSSPPQIISGVNAEENIRSSIKTINISGDQIVIIDEIPGVYCRGVQYYDLKNIGYINYNGMAKLVDFLRSLLEKGVEVKFVNVNDMIIIKIKSMRLEHILNCV